MSLISDAVKSWNGEGTIRWAKSTLDRVQRESKEDEQLVIFRGENDI